MIVVIVLYFEPLAFLLYYNELISIKKTNRKTNDMEEAIKKTKEASCPSHIINQSFCKNREKVNVTFFCNI